jgi:predicted DNA-binding ribbon-helix-helix protein
MAPKPRQPAGRAGGKQGDRVKRKQSADSPRKSSLGVKRYIRTVGRKTNITLEDEFWNALKEIAVSKNTSRPKLVSMIDKTRSHPNLSSAVRLFVLDYYRGLANNRTARQ